MTGTKKKRKSSHQKKESGRSGILSSAFKSALIALLTSLFLALIVSAIALRVKDPIEAVTPMSLAVLYICSFLSGFLCMKKLREGTLLCGALSGAIFMMLYISISLFLPKDFSSSRSFGISFLLHALMILFSICGAYIAKKGLGKRKKKRK